MEGAENVSTAEYKFPFFKNQDKCRLLYTSPAK